MFLQGGVKDMLPKRAISDHRQDGVLECSGRAQDEQTRKGDVKVFEGDYSPLETWRSL